MPIINKPSGISKAKIKFEISNKLKEEIDEYCAWADFEKNHEHFFVEAAEYLLSKDKEWQHKRKQKVKENQLKIDT